MVQLPHESIPQLVAGTKRNDLLWIQFHRIPDSMQVQTSCLFTSRDDDNDDAYKKAKLQLPIYSLAFDPTTQTLFVGSGDRYVSLWNNNNNKHRWQQ
jgi:WD40 repeat protein